MPASEKTSKGFTLVELIVVMAIMTILTGIMFPVFGRVRENARRASCIANLYSLGAALKMYRLDHYRLDPPWLSALVTDNYVGSAGVLICPSDGKKGEQWRWFGATEADFAELDDFRYSGNNLPCSYAYEFAAAPCSWDSRVGDAGHDWHYFDGSSPDAEADPPQVYPADLPLRCPRADDVERAHAAYSQTAAEEKVPYPAGGFWSWRDIKMMQVHGKYCPVCRTTRHGETQCKKPNGTIGFPLSSNYGDFTAVAPETSSIYGFGDVVPMVRCVHHVRSAQTRYMNQGLNYVNLAYGGYIYLSNAQWELDQQIVTP